MMWTEIQSAWTDGSGRVEARLSEGMRERDFGLRRAMSLGV